MYQVAGATASARYIIPLLFRKKKKQFLYLCCIVELPHLTFDIYTRTAMLSLSWIFKLNNYIFYLWQRKFTSGIDGVEITRDALIKHQAIVLFYSTAFFIILQPHSTVFLFHNPHICALKYSFFFVSTDKLWLILSMYFPTCLCLFFSELRISRVVIYVSSAPTAFGRAFSWYLTSSNISPPFRWYALNRAIFSAPQILQPIGLELIREASTWLTCPSVLLPTTPSLCLSRSLAAVQFERIYSATSSIRLTLSSFWR